MNVLQYGYDKCAEVLLCSCAKEQVILCSLWLWYMRHVHVLSMDSLGRGSGSGGGVFAGDVEEAMCSGV
jgi:hypothetical protein